MSIEHHWEERGLWIRYLDSISGQEVLDAALAVSGDPRFDDIRYAIIDLSRATLSTVNMQDIELLASYTTAMSKSNPRVKNAVVTYKEEGRQALAALYEMLHESSSWQVQLFENLEDARAWACQ